MDALIIGAGIAVGVLIFVAFSGYRMGQDDNVGQDIRDINKIEGDRRRKLIALNKAYTLAREELGEEPTIEQIMLTRDTMEDVDGTP